MDVIIIISERGRRRERKKKKKKKKREGEEERERKKRKEKVMSWNNDQFLVSEQIGNLFALPENLIHLARIAFNFKFLEKPKYSLETNISFRNPSLRFQIFFPSQIWFI